MRRLMLAAVLAMLAVFAVAAPAAMAHGDRGFGGGAWDGPAGEADFGPEEGEEGGEAVYLFTGTVTAVNAEAGTVTATVRARGGDLPGDVQSADNRYCGNRFGAGEDAETPDTENTTAGAAHRRGGRGARGGSGGGATQSLTFKTDEDTLVVRNRREAALSALAVGDSVSIAIVGDEGLTQEQVLALPAWMVTAKAKPAATALYGFSGNVTAVDAAGGKLTVSVRYATKAARAVIGTERPQSLTFTIGDSTRIVRDGERVELSELAAGDLAGVGIRAPKGATKDTVLGTAAKAVVAYSSTQATSARLRRLGSRAASAARRR